MPNRLYADIIEEIQALKRQRSALIVAHNYQDREILEVADVAGDSLKLAIEATRSEAQVIVFCGVHFMAETVALMAPDKTILLPDPQAGCTLADMVTPRDILAWRAEHPDGVVVCYINTSAAVKAECDWVCTSSNAEQVIGAIPEDRPILFVPDFFLGTYLQKKTGRAITLWQGYCPAHVVIDPDHIDQLRREHPNAEFLMHPECGCLTRSMHLADRVASTDEMVRHVKSSGASEFIIATENGILNRMQKENPHKVFYPASPHAVCGHMRRNTLEKVVSSLENLQYPVRVPQPLARRALIPLRRMMELSCPTA